MAPLSALAGHGSCPDVALPMHTGAPWPCLFLYPLSPAKDTSKQRKQTQPRGELALQDILAPAVLKSEQQ